MLRSSCKLCTPFDCQVEGRMPKTTMYDLTMTMNSTERPCKIAVVDSFFSTVSIQFRCEIRCPGNGIAQLKRTLRKIFSTFHTQKETVRPPHMMVMMLNQIVNGQWASTRRIGENRDSFREWIISVFENQRFETIFLLNYRHGNAMVTIESFRWVCPIKWQTETRRPIQWLGIRSAWCRRSLICRRRSISIVDTTFRLAWRAFS